MVRSGPLMVKLGHLKVRLGHPMVRLGHRMIRLGLIVRFVNFMVRSGWLMDDKLNIIIR